MREFIDREIAIKSMNKILTEHTTPWIVLSGDSRIGKTEFAKKISSMYENTIFCTPRLSGNYACSFVQSINLCKFCSNGTPILKLAVHPF